MELSHGHVLEYLDLPDVLVDFSDRVELFEIILLFPMHIKQKERQRLYLIQQGTHSREYTRAKESR